MPPAYGYKDGFCFTPRVGARGVEVLQSPRGGIIRLGQQIPKEGGFALVFRNASYVDAENVSHSAVVKKSRVSPATALLYPTHVNNLVDRAMAQEKPVTAFREEIYGLTTLRATPENAVIRQRLDGLHLGEAIDMGQMRAKLTSLAETSDPELDSMRSRRERLERLFEQEFATLGILQGIGSVPRVYGQGTDEYGVPFVAMEQVAGVQLSRVVGKQRLRRSVAGHVPSNMTNRNYALVMAEVLGDLAQVHDEGIVHRDLYPDAIFLTFDTSDNRWKFNKLIDWNVAIGMASHPEIEPIETILGEERLGFGKKGYFLSSADVPLNDPRRDLYSMGVMLERFADENSSRWSANARVTAEVIIRAATGKTGRRLTDARDERRVNEILTGYSQHFGHSRGVIYPNAEEMQRDMRVLADYLPEFPAYKAPFAS